MKEKILAAVDFSPVSVKVLRTATALAEKFSAQVYAIFVMNTTDLRYALAMEIQGDMKSSVLLKKKVRANIENKFVNLIKRSVRPEHDIKTLISRGEPSREINRAARKLGASLIVIGTRGLSDIATVFLGSTARDVIRSADSPVVIVHKRRRS